MSGTYRFGIAILRDGHGRHGATARTGAAEMKKIDRRKKRREHKRITDKAISMMIDDSAADAREIRLQEQADFDAWVYEDLVEIERDDFESDFNDDYWPGDYDDDPRQDMFDDYGWGGYYD